MSNYKNIILKDGKWFIKMDDIGRIVIPQLISSPEERRKKYIVYQLSEDKIFIGIDKMSEMCKFGRATIPFQIRRVMNLKKGDTFELKRAEKGFLIIKTNMEE